MCHPIEEAAALGALCEKANVMAIGLGLGQSAWAVALLARALDSGLPLCVDADGLHLLAEEPMRREDRVLTPHPGEAGRLLGCDTQTVQADRFEAARGLQRPLWRGSGLEGHRHLGLRPSWPDIGVRRGQSGDGEWRHGRCLERRDRRAHRPGVVTR